MAEALEKRNGNDCQYRFHNGTRASGRRWVDQSYTDASLPVALPPMAGAGEREAVLIILNDILLFACAITLVTGIVLTAARLFI